MNRSDVTLIAVALLAIVNGGLFILVQSQISRQQKHLAKLAKALNLSADVTAILAKDYAVRSAAKKAGK